MLWSVQNTDWEDLHIPRTTCLKWEFGKDMNVECTTLSMVSIAIDDNFQKTALPEINVDRQSVSHSISVVHQIISPFSTSKFPGENNQLVDSACAMDYFLQFSHGYHPFWRKIRNFVGSDSILALPTFPDLNKYSSSRDFKLIFPQLSGFSTTDLHPEQRLAKWNSALEKSVRNAETGTFRSNCMSYSFSAVIESSLPNSTREFILKKGFERYWRFFCWKTAQTTHWVKIFKLIELKLWKS